MNSFFATKFLIVLGIGMLVCNAAIVLAALWVNPPDDDMEAARPSGIPVNAPGAPGMLETNVIRVHNPANPFYDATGKSVDLF